jgi:probable HAF family extracellular repeat protein
MGSALSELLTIIPRINGGAAVIRRCLIGVVLLSLVQGNVCVAVQYSVTDLGSGYAFDINNVGQVTGYTIVNSNSHAFLWQNGSGMQVLGTLGGYMSWGMGVNDSGTVAGYSYNSSNIEHAFLWQSGTAMQDLGAGYGFGINNSGQVVGEFIYTGNRPHAFLWRNGSGMQDIGTLGGGGSVAHAINNHGQVVGEATTANDTVSHAFLWQSGSPMQDLGTFEGKNTVATDVNDLGLVVGYNGSTVTHHAFLWQNDKGMQSLGVLPGGFNASYAHGVNDNGEIVGDCYMVDQYSRDSNYHAFIYSNETMTDLNSLITPSLGWTLNVVCAINNSRQIVGYGTIGGQTHAFLLTPIPEPSTLILFAVAAISFLAFRRQPAA